MRRPLIAGNWKMYKTAAEAEDLVRALLAALAGGHGAEVLLCPPFTALARVARLCAGRAISLGAQNMHWQAEGPFTGEVSPPMLKNLGCGYVIIGHSERRQHFGETDVMVAQKVRAACRHGLVPVLCVGETLAEREAGQTMARVLGQIRADLAGIEPQQAAGLVIAYEPIWAIGTGRTATPADAAEVTGAVRQEVERLFPGAGATMRLLYGGSVKPDNIRALMAVEDIDGALVGGASLDVASFKAIVEYDA